MKQLKLSFGFLLLALFLSCGRSEKPVYNFHKSAEAIALNHQLARGWNTWNTRSVLSQVLLPQSFAVGLQLQDPVTGAVLKEALIGRRGEDAEMVAPGPHAYDGSYTELTSIWKELEVNVKTAADGDQLAIIITPNGNKGRLIIKPEVIWGMNGKTKITERGFSFDNDSIQANFYVLSSGRTEFTDTLISCDLDGKVVLSTYADKSAAEIEAFVDLAGNKLAERKKSYGSDSALYEAMQTVLAWDVIYEPTRKDVISPVSRIWNCGWGGWVLFDWDTYFASFMYSLDNKGLAYANAIAITREISKAGFIPNFGSGNGKSEDRSQPPVGSYVVWNIYERYHEKWFLEEVFDELLSWNRWWKNNRDVDGYLCWGSDTCTVDMPQWLTSEIGKKQAAMWESGLDNSPMYDDAVFDTVTHKLMLADVGLISMYIWDCRYLAKIADELGQNKVKKELEQRASTYAGKLETLWNDNAGMYLNKDLVTGKFSKKMSPTLFYPLLTGVPTTSQAERMIREHFCNPEEFRGDWIMPSIARNDSAFKDNDYWRGRIWAPMNFLVYCGLKNYDLPDAKKELAEKSKALILKSWLEERHVYENYNAVTGQGSDVDNSDKFYHWGALLAFISLLENEHQSKK